MAELLKDYIGLIQAVKVRNDVIKSTIIHDVQYFSNHFPFISLYFNTLNAGRLFKKSPLVVFYEALLQVDMFLEIFRAKLGPFFIPCFGLLLRNSLLQRRNAVISVTIWLLLKSSDSPEGCSILFFAERYMLLYLVLVSDKLCLQLSIESSHESNVKTQTVL